MGRRELSSTRSRRRGRRMSGPNIEKSTRLPSLRCPLRRRRRNPRMKTMDLDQRSLQLIQMIRLHRQRLQRRKLKQWCETRFRSPFHSESPPWSSSSFSSRKYYCLVFSQKNTIAWYFLEKIPLLGIFSTASEERRVLCRREQSPSSRSSSCFVQSCNVRALNLRRGGFKYILPMRVLPILIYFYIILCSNCTFCETFSQSSPAAHVI